MIIFNPQVFTLSNNFSIETVPTSLGNIFVIENFYNDIETIYEEIEKLPMSLNWNAVNREKLENRTIDGRKCYVNSIQGAELPYVEQLPSKIYKYLNLEQEQIYIPENLSINCSKKLKKYPKNSYFNIHTDPLIYSKSVYQYAIIVFLNTNYTDKTVGLNIYNDHRELFFKNKNNFFFKHDEINLAHFVQAKPNRAVIIPKDALHGPELGSDYQFYEEWRYTQVIFVPVFNSHKNIELKYV